MEFVGFKNLDVIKLRSDFNARFEIIDEICEILMDESLSASDWEELSCLLTVIERLKIRSSQLMEKALEIDLNPYPEGF